MFGQPEWMFTNGIVEDYAYIFLFIFVTLTIILTIKILFYTHKHSNHPTMYANRELQKINVRNHRLFCVQTIISRENGVEFPYLTQHFASVKRAKPTGAVIRQAEIASINHSWTFWFSTLIRSYVYVCVCVWVECRITKFICISLASIIASI